MANSLAGFLAVYANESLPQLIAQAPLVSGFTTDFSNAVAQGGTSVITRLPSTTYSLNDTEANGYAAASATASAVTVTLKQRDITHAFSEVEALNLNQIYNTFVPAMTKALINGITVDVMSLVTNANFSTAQVTPVASFSGSAVVKLAQTLSTANVPYEGRSLFILPTAYETLVNSVSPAYSYGNAEVVQNYRNMNYAGFKVWEYSAIPANSENLIGFAAGPAAIAIATRQPQVPGNFPGEIASVTDPVSGLTIQFRQWHSADDGKFKLTATLIYGAAKGNGSALKRVTSS